MSILLERESFLHTLEELFRQAVEGRGQVVLISGEAGIGKTSLVEGFLARHPSGMRSLWGACEALFTPRPLGPLYDIAAHTHGPLQTLLGGEGNRAALFAAVLEELATGTTPTIFVIEDIHWADEATLDLLKFMARRLHRMRALLLVTYREEELGREHPLRLVLGDLPARDVTRLWLPPLSEAAVTTLARQAKRSIEHLHAVTGGNPFFLTEVLRREEPGVPTSVSDAVLAQVARRTPEAQRLLELVAVVPSRISWGIVEAVRPAASSGLAECLEAGILHQEGTVIAYRHELARQAVERALTPARRRALHAEVLRVLLERGGEQTSLAELVHHAAEAEDGALVLRFAPAAAREAAAQGAHRAAADHYRRALHTVGLLEAEGKPELQAVLLAELAEECALTGQRQEAFQAHTSALVLWRRLERTAQVGHTLQRLSDHAWHLGRGEDASRYALEAVELLERLPPSRELGQAYAHLASLYMVANNTPETLVWGKRAIEVAERCHDAETSCYALLCVGAITFSSGDESGRVMLEQSLQMAQAHGFEDLVALAYVNLADIRIRSRAYAQAMGYLEEGLAYCAEHDLDARSATLRSERARAWLEQGAWAEAGEEATTLLSVPGLSATNRIPALVVLGLLRARRGDPGVEAMLDEARDLAQATGEMRYIAEVAAARAEWQWLQGNRGQCAVEAALGVLVAFPCQRPWNLGEVAIWLWRGGELPEGTEAAVALPFASAMLGNWQGAAAWWAEVGCPYEQALALAEGDAAAQRQAIALFEQLGAQPAAARVRQRMREQGRTGIPRGPRPSTRANQAGLTSREVEVLLLLAEGLSNTQIAQRLSTSPKTVVHQVSAIFAKLEVHSRAQALTAASTLGLLPPQDGNPPRVR